MGANYKKIGKIIGAIIVVYIGFKYILPLVVPFVLGLVFAMCIEKPVAFFERYRIKRGISAAIILLIATAFFGILLWIFGRFIGTQAIKFKEAYDFRWNEISDRVVGACMESVVPALNMCTEWIVVAIVTLIATVLTSIYLSDIKGYIKRRKEFDLIRKMYEKTYKIGIAYIRAQLVLMVITAVLCCVGFLIIKSSYWAIMGVIVGVLDALPFIGCGIILIPWTVVMIIRKEYINAAVIFTLLVVCSIVRRSLEPKLIGDRIGVTPLEILFSVYVGIKLFGFLGFILGPVGYVFIKEIVFYI